MKKIFTKTIAILILSAGLLISLPAFADDPPPPPTHGEVGDIPGGSAPIGEGLLILSVLGAAYGTKKWYSNHKQKIAE